LSTKEKAYYIFSRLTEEQLAAFVTLFGGLSIQEEEPDEWDRAMIEDSKTDNEESVPLDKFVRELGFNPNDFQN
jgi:hypothetical protein